MEATYLQTFHLQRASTRDPKRPHKDKDLTFWFHGPRGLPEIMFCRILMFIWEFPKIRGLDIAPKILGLLLEGLPKRGP